MNYEYKCDCGNILILETDLKLSSNYKCFKCKKRISTKEGEGALPVKKIKIKKEK